VKRARFFTSALLECSITPEAVAEDWPDWFDLAPAFVLVYGTTELQEMQDEAVSVPVRHRGWPSALGA